MNRLVGRIPIRQILPRRARAQNPQDAVQHSPGIFRRSAPTILAAALPPQEWFNDLPLFVGQVHAAGYDGLRSTVDEIASTHNSKLSHAG